MNIDEFKGYLHIDKKHLDDEVIQHADLYFEVAEAAVFASSRCESKKEALAEVDATLDSLIRKTGEKLTESAIKGQIQLHQDHKKAMADYLETKEHAAVLTALKESFYQRGKLLRELCQLHIESLRAPTSFYNETVYDYRQRQQAAVQRKKDQSS